MKIEKLKSKQKVKTAKTKFMTQVDTYIETIDFENKDSFEQLSEFLSNLQEKKMN